jgi:hypothetical protein
MTDKTGGPAFPGVRWVQQGDKVNPEGMTLRDYFAAKAMQAIFKDGVANQSKVEDLARLSYLMADVMLRERAK